MAEPEPAASRPIPEVPKEPEAPKPTESLAETKPPAALEDEWKRANDYTPPEGATAHVKPVPSSFWKPDKPSYSLLNVRDGTRGGTATGSWDEIVARADKENNRMAAYDKQRTAPGTDEYEKLRAQVADLEAKANPSADQNLFREGVAMEKGRVGSEASEFGQVSSGLTNVLKEKGIKPSLDKAYWKSVGGDPLYWELNDLFHDPLASMNPSMSVENIGRAMDTRLTTSNPKIDERGYKFKNSFDMGRPSESMEKDLAEGGKFGQELTTAERGADRMRRKADIVQALVGDTENVKAARAAADALEADAGALRERAQGAIATAKEAEATTAKELKERPITLAKQIQPIENAKWTVKNAWNGNIIKEGEQTPWISDGHSAINMEQAARKGAANMAGGRKFASAKAEKLSEHALHNAGVSAENMQRTLDITTKKSNSPGEIIGYLSKEALGKEKFDTAYIQNSVSKKIIPVQAPILRMIQDVIKPDAIKVGGADSAVAFYKGDKLAAVIMPLRTEPEIDVPTAKATLAARGAETK